MDTCLETVNQFVLLFALLLVANANLWVMGPKSLELSLCHFDHFLSISFTSVEDVCLRICAHTNSHGYVHFVIHMSRQLGKYWEDQRPRESQSAATSHKMRKSCSLVLAKVAFLKLESALYCKSALIVNILWFLVSCC